MLFPNKTLIYTLYFNSKFSIISCHENENGAYYYNRAAIHYFPTYPENSNIPNQMNANSFLVSLLHLHCSKCNQRIFPRQPKHHESENSILQSQKPRPRGDHQGVTEGDCSPQEKVEVPHCHPPKTKRPSPDGSKPKVNETRDHKPTKR